MWEKEKLLVASNFSFSHSVFKRLVSQGHQKASLCGNGLIQIQQNDLFHNYAFRFFNSLPNNKFLDRSKFLAFADNNINVTEKVKFVLDG